MQSQTVEMHKANVHSHHTYTAPYTAHTNPDFCAIYDFGLNKLIARNVFGFKCVKIAKWILAAIFVLHRFRVSASSFHANSSRVWGKGKAKKIY